MAHRGKFISNPVSGQDILFINTAKDTDGHLLEMETTYRAHSAKPTAHYHPGQEEDFKVTSGEVTVEMNGVTQVLHTGDTLHIPRNMIHAMWNSGEQKAVVNWKVRPAMNTENLLENVMGLARDNKVNRNGLPNLFQTALLVNRFTKEYRVAKPPFVMQRIIFTILTPFAFLLGYRSSYKKYVD